MNLDSPPAPSLTTLTTVELRKMTDTRAGRWMLAVIALAGVALVAVVLFAGKKGERGADDMYLASLTGVFVLGPILGVIAVTSEWSQRTALTTFALVPQRFRVVAAKLSAATLFAVLSVAAGVLAGWAGRALGVLTDRTDGEDWGVPAALAGTSLLHVLLVILMGMAFGMIFRNAPLAIVLYFVLPTVWAILAENVARIRKPAGWFDTSKTLEPLVQSGVHLTGEQWARVGTSTALWLLLPLAIGLWRVVSSEVK